jgi:hypothetical protein
MILPDFKIVSLANVESEFTGVDSIEYCQSKTYFREYPYEISYKYNSRGFRDDEWPDNLEDCIWCFGDSYTVGIGQSYNHIWPKVLQSRTGRRTICVSMNGASNNWISRKIVELVNTIQPETIVVQWSFINRRERELAAGETDTDENRRIWYNKFADYIEDIQNTLDCITRSSEACDSAGVKLIHSFIPEFLFSKDNNLFFQHFANLNKHWVPLSRLDQARDGKHYDVKTATAFVENLVAYGI